MNEAERIVLREQHRARIARCTTDLQARYRTKRMEEALERAEAKSQENGDD